MSGLRRGVSLALAGTGLLVLSYASDTSATGGKRSLPFAESTTARARIDELSHWKTLAGLLVLGPAVATRFEVAGGPHQATHFRAVFPVVKPPVARAASVELPMRADGESNIEDATSHVSVRFRLHDAKPSSAEVVDGYALYVGALPDADLVHRVYAEGTEDYVVFETRPAREELLYSVNVSRVPGLRLVSNTLEFIDESGSPALRVAPPYVVDALGARHGATLAVSGCAVDARATAPWGRPVTKPGADRCIVHVTWSGVAYPAIVDPTWSATGSMATARSRHTATVLASGRVLVAGGDGASSAELFDPSANFGVGAFAATGSMRTSRLGHTASVLASGKVLIVGGWGKNVRAEIFDPKAGTFTFTGSMATARRGHTASVLASGKVLVTGGNPVTEGVGTAEIFDPDANGGAGAFAATGTMTQARDNHTASVLGSGKVLIAGGWDIARAEIFDPDANGGTGAFAATGTMTQARTQHTASVLASGKVLLAGGFGNARTAYLANAELFDPSANGGTGAFTPTGSMALAREYHTASVLPSGRVLVTGGLSSAISPQATTDERALMSAELFDPDANDGVGGFADAGAMAAARWAHTASVLRSGKVLVAGGLSAELFGGGQGDACSNDDGCHSGFCVDLRCCDSACTGSCDRCDLPGTEGTCTAAPNDATKDCAPYKCDRAGHHGSCHTQCTSVADCIAPTVCDTSHQCVVAVVEARPDGSCSMIATSASGSRELSALAIGLAMLAVRRPRRSDPAQRNEP